MIAKDAYHENVRNALIKDGWEITDDPFIIEYEDLRIFADLGAEKLSINGDKKIAIEIKVLGGISKISEFEKALGQYDLYEIYLEELEPDRQLFPAISEEVFQDFFKRPAISFAINKKRVKLLLFNPQKEEIVKWIK